MIQSIDSGRPNEPYGYKVKYSMLEIKAFAIDASMHYLKASYML